MLAEALVIKSPETRGVATTEVKQIVSFEHLEKYYELTRQMLEAGKTEDRVDLVLAPLEPMNILDKEFLYYSCRQKLDSIKSAFQGKNARILVIVDGPPQQTGPKARFPALPLLLEFLAEHQLDIIVDDYARQPEKEMVSEWERILESESLPHFGEFIEAEKGAYLLAVNREPQPE